MRRLFALIVCLAAAAANARVISYAPYTNRNATPALQSRLNRHFVLYESDPATYTGGQVVLYDSKGEEEPRVIYPTDTTKTAPVIELAVREDDTQLAIFLAEQQGGSFAWRLSTDGGTTWQSVGVPPDMATNWNMSYGSTDTGGLFARSRYSQIRIGTHDKPFVFVARNTFGGSTVYAVGNDASLKSLFTDSDAAFHIAGTSIDGAQIFAHDKTAGFIIGVDATFRVTPPPPATVLYSEGWLTQSGQVYLEVTNVQSTASLLFFDGTSWKWIDGDVSTQLQPPGSPIIPPNPNPSPTPFFAVPR